MVGTPFSANGQELAVANTNDNTMSAFSVATNGSLARLSGSPFASGANPWGVAFDPLGRFLTVAATTDSALTVFSTP